MTDWARLSVGFYRHPRTRRLSKDAQHLYLASILHCVEFGTDGRFPADETPLLASISRVRVDLAAELLESGSWIDHGDEVEVRDFLHYQTPAEVVRARSNAARQAAESRWSREAERNANGNAPGNAKRIAEGNASRGEESREQSPRSETDSDPAFDVFWKRYPARNGKKVEKGKALSIWKRMSKKDQALASIGVKHYADSGCMPKDAHRWLRDECWVDWQTPATTDMNGHSPARPKQVIG